MSNAAIIVNPNAGRGKAKTPWPRLQAMLREALGPLDILETGAPGDAERLTRAALQAGAERIIAIGGDGTLNETVNGFFLDDQATPANPNASLSFLMSGTGGDFARSFDLPDAEEERINRLAAAPVRKIDVGLCHLTNHQGQPIYRYFDNIGSFGMSGDTCFNVNNATWQKKLGAAFAYNWGVLTAFVTFRKKNVLISADDSPAAAYPVNLATMCNGRYFGAGMLPGPNAKLDDGLFDVLILSDASIIDFLLSFPALRKGTAPSHKKATNIQGRKIAATLDNKDDIVLIELDGETPGRLPATFTIMPAALNLQV